MKLLNVIKPNLSSFGEGGVVHMDCQRSAMNAFQRTFHCEVRLSLFHMYQALWRVVVKTGWQKGTTIQIIRIFTLG